MNLEDKLKKLKEITEKLEKGDVGIDEGIALFKEGSELAKECYVALKEAKGKVTIIKKEIDTFKEENM